MWSTSRLMTTKRLESESVDFHERVRKAFLAQAERAPERYLVLDASQSVDPIQALVRDRVRVLLQARAQLSPPSQPALVNAPDARDGSPVEAVLQSLVTPDGPGPRHAAGPEAEPSPDLAVRGRASS